MAATRMTRSPATISQPAVAGSQTKPASIVQSAAQPSPAVVLPSSQSSPMTRPSPHSELQGPAAQSGSAWHNAEQPSKGSVLPSSQLSAPSCTPSPQVVAEHALGLPSHL